jgi:hypothetical protein
VNCRQFVGAIFCRENFGRMDLLPNLEICLWPLKANSRSSRSLKTFADLRGPKTKVRRRPPRHANFYRKQPSAVLSIRRTSSCRRRQNLLPSFCVYESRIITRETLKVRKILLSLLYPRILGQVHINLIKLKWLSHRFPIPSLRSTLKT